MSRAYSATRVRVIGAERVPENVRPRTILQAIANRNRRSHAVRAIARVTGLLVLDISASMAGMWLLEWSHHLAGSIGVAGWQQANSLAGLPPVQSVTAICSGLFLAGAYNGGDARRNPERVASGTGLGLMIALWPSLWRNFSTDVSTDLLSAAVLILLLVLVRWCVDRVVSKTRPEALTPGRVLVVGTPADTADFHELLAARDGTSYRAVGTLDPSIRRRNPDEASDVYGLDDLPQALAERRVDTIVLCGPLQDNNLTHLMSFADAGGCRVLAPSRAFTLAQLTPSVHWRDGVPMIQLTRPGLRGRDLLLKRMLDLTVGSVMLAVAQLMMIPVALAVRLTSPGPVIFRQRRVGYAGRTFTIYKFRTMYVDAEARAASLAAGSVYTDGKLFKMQNDPRITPLGRWLRMSSLDELPQLINVLVGDMSLVGPRPPLPREVDLYDDDEFIRFGMKPGITGPWQVSGRNRITSFGEVLRIESAYFAQWTIWRDFSILARTIPAVLKMDGAQ
ncbi:MAG: sugar transferase [Gemmatimonadota bacterium]